MQWPTPWGRLRSLAAAILCQPCTPPAWPTRLRISLPAAELHLSSWRERNSPAREPLPTRNKFVVIPSGRLAAKDFRICVVPTLSDFSKGFHVPQKVDGRKLEDVQESQPDSRLFPQLPAHDCRPYSRRSCRLPALHRS